MKISKSQLKQIIQEELAQVIKEEVPQYFDEATQTWKDRPHPSSPEFDTAVAEKAQTTTRLRGASGVVSDAAKVKAASETEEGEGEGEGEGDGGGEGEGDGGGEGETSGWRYLEDDAYLETTGLDAVIAALWGPDS